MLNHGSFKTERPIYTVSQALESIKKMNFLYDSDGIFGGLYTGNLGVNFEPKRIYKIIVRADNDSKVTQIVLLDKEASERYGYDVSRYVTVGELRNAFSRQEYRDLPIAIQLGNHVDNAWTAFSYGCDVCFSSRYY